MSLPSQTARTSSSGRSFVYRRKRSRRPGPIAVLGGGGLLVVLLIVGFFVIDPFGADAEESGDPGGGVTDPLVAGPGGDGAGDGNGAVVFDQGSRSRRGSEGGERFGRSEQAKSRADRRPATAAIPTEEVAIPELVPPPLEEKRGMLDEALATDGTAGGSAGETADSNARTNRPAERLTDRTSGGSASRTPATPTKDDPTPTRGTDTSESGTISAHLRAADDLIARNDPLAARQALWDAMRMPGLDPTQLSVLRTKLTELNSDLLFGPVRRAGDPLSKSYTVRSGDALSKIARREDLGTHWKLIQRVNELAAPERIRVGQTLKLVPGTFHAVVDKSDFRLDLYHGEPERPEGWVFIRSFDVGLGEGDSTPIGQFIVRADGKLENPGWVNPRDPTEKYGPNDPQNPIGDFWVGLDGLGDAAAYAGYGLHGTIDPNSIGRERSMGCVRMRSDDIALVYELMSEGKSLVRIRR